MHFMLQCEISTYLQSVVTTHLISTEKHKKKNLIKFETREVDVQNANLFPGFKTHYYTNPFSTLDF